MIIGFDASRAFVENRTGTENYSYQLLRHLLKIDKYNQYFVYVRSGKIKDAIIQENVKYKQIQWPRFWTQGGLALQTFRDNLDVLFVPSHTLPIIRRPGLKTVMTVHDLGAEYLPKLHKLKQQLYLKYITRYQLDTATKLIAVSKATKKDLVKRAGIDTKRISVVFEGYDKEKFKVQSSKFKVATLNNILKYYDLVSGEYFLFVGTVQPRKNLARLIQAFAKFSREYKVSSIEGKKQRDKSHHTLYSIPYTLAIVGSKGWLSDDIYELPKKLGIENKVKFLGYVPDKDMPAIYSGAVALIFPSLFEGFGLPILEAQACGCPVITSNISSMPEVGGPTSPRLRGVKKGAILVDPYSIEDIANAMIKVMDEKIRKNIIKEGFENIKRFSWEKCAKETLKVLEAP